jgi:hypothetical protein
MTGLYVHLAGTIIASEAFRNDTAKNDLGSLANWSVIAV